MHPYYKEIEILINPLLEESNILILSYEGKGREVSIKIEIRGEKRIFLINALPIKIRNIKKYIMFIAMSMGKVRIRDYKKAFNCELLEIMEEVFFLENIIINGDRFSYNFNEAKKIYRNRNNEK